MKDRKDGSRKGGRWREGVKEGGRKETQADSYSPETEDDPWPLSCPFLLTSNFIFSNTHTHTPIQTEISLKFMEFIQKVILDVQPIPTQAIQGSMFEFELLCQN